MSIRISMRGMRELEMDVQEALRRQPAMLRQAVEETAEVVRDDARRIIGKGPHTPQYADSITYDIRASLTHTTAEIGPDKGMPQGPLGNILEFGTVNNAPRPHLGPSLMKNAGLFEANVDRQAARLMP